MNFRNTAEALGGTETLSDSDLDDLGKGVRLVHELMKDGRWHTADEVKRATGQREGLRRLRELRRFGFVVEKKLIGKRTWAYQLVQKHDGESQ